MKQTTISDQELKMDFDVLLRHENFLPARLMYDLTCNLLTAATAEKDPIIGRSFQWFVANMVECCYGVKKPSDNSPRLLSDEGLRRLYTQDLNPRDLTTYIISVLATAKTVLENYETPEERRFGKGLWTAHASMVHGVAQWINDVKPTQSSDR